jgi:hypothetical protein
VGMGLTVVVVRGGSAYGYDMIYDIVTRYSDTELLALCFLQCPDRIRVVVEGFMR